MGFKKLLLLVLIIFLLVPLVSAKDETILHVNAKDITTNEVITSIPVIFNARNLNLNVEEKSTEHLDAKGIFEYALIPGNWNVQVSLFNPTTDEIDYYSERAIYIQKGEPFLNKTFYFSPVGAIEGVVKDINGNLVSFAELDFECTKEIRADSPDKTTNFGSFKAILMPVGKCKIFAAFQNLVGVKEVEVRKGELVPVEVILEGSLTSQGPSLSWLVYVLIALGVAIIGVLFVLMRKKLKNDIEKDISKEVKKQAKKIKKKEPKPKEEPEEESEVNPRARDIIKTLGEKEQKVVDFLFESNNQSTQAKIRNSTGIPKTSLARILQKLESKKIIEIERVGKLKKIKFTDWFMGKD